MAVFKLEQSMKSSFFLRDEIGHEFYSSGMNSAHTIAHTHAHVHTRARTCTQTREGAFGAAEKTELRLLLSFLIDARSRNFLCCMDQASKMDAHGIRSVFFTSSDVEAVRDRRPTA